ncbi:MAG TPA: mechanosensitive ion channel family protein [Gemmatimonadaceae bacterium]|nr:mechanosensitive ion channel family protein [Gemmatimonadaceae bacterium]
MLSANTPVAWLTAALIFVLVAGALYALKWLLTRRLARLAERTETRVDDAFVAIFAATNFLFIAAIALQAAIPVLRLPNVVVRVANGFTIIAVAIQVGLWGRAAVRAVVSGYLQRHADGASRTAVSAVGFLAQITIWSIVTVAALTTFGYDVTALLTTLGIGGIALALAVQNILGDLFAALSIVVDKPFLVGETIDVDGQSGTVERIGLKTTRVRGIGGEEIIYSNADLLKARVRNYTRMRERRLVGVIRLAYETPVGVVERIPLLIKETIQAQPNVRFDRANLVRIGDASLDFEYVFFSLQPDANLGMDLQQAVYLGLLRRFESEGVAIAFPTRVIIQRSDGALVVPNANRSAAARQTD